MVSKIPIQISLCPRKPFGRAPNRLETARIVRRIFERPDRQDTKIDVVVQQLCHKSSLQPTQARGARTPFDYGSEHDVRVGQDEHAGAPHNLTYESPDGGPQCPVLQQIGMLHTKQRKIESSRPPVQPARQLSYPAARREDLLTIIRVVATQRGFHQSWLNSRIANHLSRTP